MVSMYLLHPEADVATIVEPNGQRIPIRYKHPLPHVELASRDYQGVLNRWQQENNGVETSVVLRVPAEREVICTIQAPKT